MKNRIMTAKEANELGVWSKFCKSQEWNESFLEEIKVTNSNLVFSIPEELFNEDSKKSYELTDTQVKIINGALDRHYYNCKDIGDDVGMKECIEIGKILERGMSNEKE